MKNGFQFSVISFQLDGLDRQLKTENGRLKTISGGMKKTMKHQILVNVSLRYGALLLLLCCCAPLCLAQNQQSADQAEIADMLKKHDDAMNRQDLDGVMALYSSNPKTVMIGTGPGEKFQGEAEIRSAYGEMFKDYDKGTLNHSCYWKDGRGSGDVVWGAFMCKFSDSKSGKNREYELNVTAVAEKQADKWQFVMVHYSNLVGSGSPTKQ
jgi:ketosteroid isomerase-like protein